MHYFAVCSNSCVPKLDRAWRPFPTFSNMNYILQWDFKVLERLTSKTVCQQHHRLQPHLKLYSPSHHSSGSVFSKWIFLDSFISFGLWSGQNPRPDGASSPGSPGSCWLPPWQTKPATLWLSSSPVGSRRRCPTWCWPVSPASEAGLGLGRTASAGGRRTVQGHKVMECEVHCCST